MAGHSKWHNIQRRKGKTDAARAKIFTKLGRELAVAVKEGGPDPDKNAKLRDAIAKAKSSNMPNDNISRSIKRAAGSSDSVNYEEIVYEGYGVGGTAFIVETLTDNRNRTAADVRHLFDKYGGSLGQSGCVSYLFKRKGVVIVEKSTIEEDDLMLKAIEAGAEDFDSSDDEVYEIITSAQDFAQIKEQLENDGVVVLDATIEMIADSDVDPSGAQQQSLLKMIEKLEEHDDVQNVYHNANITIEEDDDES